MYTAFSEAHRGFAMLGCLTTVLWALAALIPTIRHRPAPRLWRPLFIAAMATTGLSGLTGLVVLFFGGWLSFIFPWLGIVAIALHGMAGARGRKALEAGAAGPLAVALTVQILALVVAYALMIAKPF
ncbi:hypothetical protein [Tropicimonas isoalkanivorans]|uniref:Uncharacterized protein n=1 Tax=Tropicimonas isoalkanivorans TaxID=441112 RepID=A0A1I1DP16_9RHOB|nr:hypothetical protein [Tropicimonas isoalkanivorans]SFB74293.1 hypothetical protein SAMN04488094_101236 [Tropicimonas isoalkanivorans]